MNSKEKIDTIRLEVLCKDSYEFIINNFPWVSNTPTLHKLLAHTPELIRDYNDSYGLKSYSEKALEASNKYIRRFRENFARKTSFQDNIRDVFLRDYGKHYYRQITQNRRRQHCKEVEQSQQDIIFLH